jgi:RHS repeat-associated protein
VYASRVELSWGYDRYGNRLNQTLTAGSGYSGSVTVDATTNRIVQTAGTTYAYDANGNMTNDNLNTIAYDAENRAVSSSGSLGSGSYTYDGNGLRVKKVSGSTATVYIFSGSKVIAEYDNGAAPSAPSREYVYGGSALLAKIDSSGTKYYHRDHLSNRLVTSSTGATLAQMGHFPFGESWYNASNDKLIFTTYERDAESGNDYAIAKNYISRLGRFISPDTMSGNAVNPQSLNRYSYVLNNPGNLVDPSGQCGEDLAKRHRTQHHYDEGGRELDYDDLDAFLASQDPSQDPCLNGGGGGGGGGAVGGDPPLDPGPIVCLMGPDGSSCVSQQPGNPPTDNPPTDNPPTDNPLSPTVSDDSVIFAIGGVGYPPNFGGGPGKGPCAPIQLRPRSGGLGYSGNADGGTGFAGGAAAGSVGYGIFRDSKTGTSFGGFASGGTTAYAFQAVAGAPNQGGQPYALGANAGIAPNIWVSNASSAQQLHGPFTTLTVNAGAGPVKGSLQLSYGGGIWQASVGAPIPGLSAGTPSWSFTKMTTYTKTTQTGCE